KADDLLVTHVAQFAWDRAKDTSALRVLVVTDDYGGIVIKFDSAAIWAANLVGRTDNNCLNNRLFLDGAVRCSLLDGGGDDIADPSVAAAGATEYADAEDLLGARVVGNDQA